MGSPGGLWLGRLLSPVDIPGGQRSFLFLLFFRDKLFSGQSSKEAPPPSRVPGDSLGAPSGRESLPNGVPRVPLAGPALDSVPCRHFRSPAVGTNFILAFGQAATKEAPANSQLGRPYLVRILYQMGSNCTSRSVERQVWSTTDTTYKNTQKAKNHRSRTSPPPMGSVWPSSPQESHGEIIEIYYTTSSYSSFVT